MAYSVIEWFVLIFVIIAAIKLIVLIFNPKSWMNFAAKLYKSPIVLFIVELILAVVLFYYLLMDIGIVTLMAGVVLGALLTGMTFALYGKDTIAWGRKLLNKGLWKKAWLPLIIWIVLVVWTLIALF